MRLHEAFLYQVWRAGTMFAVCSACAQDGNPCLGPGDLEPCRLGPGPHPGKKNGPALRCGTAHNCRAQEHAEKEAWAVLLWQAVRRRQVSTSRQADSKPSLEENEGGHSWGLAAAAAAARGLGSGGRRVAFRAAKTHPGAASVSSNSRTEDAKRTEDPRLGPGPCNDT